MPAPTTATRRFCVVMVVFSRGGDGASGGAGGGGGSEDVLEGALGDRAGSVDRAAVHVLLDDAEDVGVDRRDRLDDGGQLGRAVRRLGHDPLRDGGGERHVVLQHVEQQLGVHLLEVQVPDAVRVLGDEPEVVPAVVGEVSRVQAEVRVLRVRHLEEAHGLAVRADVAVRVCVELLADAVLLEQRLAELVVPLAQALPLLVGQCARLEHLRGRVRAPEVRDGHEVLGTECRGEAGHRDRLVPRALELVLALVEPGEDRAGGEPQPAGLELVGQLRRVGGQVPVRAEFDPLVAGRGRLVEEALPRHLGGVVREPDAPRVGRGADPDGGGRCVRGRGAGGGGGVGHDVAVAFWAAARCGVEGQPSRGRWWATCCS
ncbi:hypothetical protein Cus16_1165 [Curtobacterium sp. ER1/6]|nr:hypothetical protein Cus16_1165 [Curtobacterium sp. ER1/6]